MVDMDRLTQLIEPAVTAEGFALVRVKMTGGGGDPTLQVMAEDPAVKANRLGLLAGIRDLSDGLVGWEALG